ncbi:hypothetical protein GGI11_000114 [Coemansia sp. RSA 2049]|nr:hypothetical protein H4217_000505 [Coemansia sp. RSA 1939]KAJ2525363.1 hypothetical protein GGI11_000114 [Coemansia sp. RSA 2049]KAJ2617557.1 hypothetical protein EV177_000520 [Coemansia sp. RSA 1804]
MAAARFSRTTITPALVSSMKHLSCTRSSMNKAPMAMVAITKDTARLQIRLLSTENNNSKHQHQLEKKKKKKKSSDDDVPLISPIGGNRISVHEHQTVINDETAGDIREPKSVDAKHDAELPPDEGLRNHERAVAEDAAAAASASASADEDSVHFVSSSPKYSRINVMPKSPLPRTNEDSSDRRGQRKPK